MSFSSKTDVMNSALRKLGAENILSFEDDNPRARLLSSSYDIKLVELLGEHPWNKAIDYVELAAISGGAEDANYEYDYMFQLPTDCIRVLGTSEGGYGGEWEEISGNRLVADSSTINIKYIKLVEDVTALGVKFCEVLAWMIAEDCAYAITQSTAQADRLERGKDKALRGARSFDAQVGSVKQVEASEWLNSRRY